MSIKRKFIVNPCYVGEYTKDEESGKYVIKSYGFGATTPCYVYFASSMDTMNYIGTVKDYIGIYFKSAYSGEDVGITIRIPRILACLWMPKRKIIVKWMIIDEREDEYDKLELPEYSRMRGIQYFKERTECKR